MVLIPNAPDLRPGAIAGVIDYYGATDVPYDIDHDVPGLAKWMEGASNQKDLASRLSPLRYVRAGLPPVLMIHGDADEMVPYRDSVKLRDSLAEARVPNELVTISGGKHGRFRWTDADTLRVQRAIEKFLRNLSLTE